MIIIKQQLTCVFRYKFFFYMSILLQLGVSRVQKIILECTPWNGG
jgi:hypothetical protein